MAGVEPIKFSDLSHVRKREIIAPYIGGAHKPHTAFHHFWRVRKCENLTNLTNLTKLHKNHKILQNLMIFSPILGTLLQNPQKVQYKFNIN